MMLIRKTVLIRVAGPGDSYGMHVGVEHGARTRAGSMMMDVYADADRHPLKPRPEVRK